MATTGPLEQRDGLTFNVALYNKTGGYISDLYLCNSCYFSYYFSDGPYTTETPTEVVFRESVDPVEVYF